MCSESVTYVTGMDANYGCDLVTTYGQEEDYGLPHGTITVGEPIEDPNAVRV
jgi:hypothetical protein